MSSVGAFPVRPFLTKSCWCPWQCTEESLCTEGTGKEFSVFRRVTYSCFFKMLENCILFCSSSCFLGSRRGGRGRQSVKNTWHLRASSYSRSFLNPSNKKNVLILCSNPLYSRPTKCINTFVAFEDFAFWMEFLLWALSARSDVLLPLRRKLPVVAGIKLCRLKLYNSTSQKGIEGYCMYSSVLATVIWMLYSLLLFYWFCIFILPSRTLNDVKLL